MTGFTSLAVEELNGLVPELQVQLALPLGASCVQGFLKVAYALLSVISALFVSGEELNCCTASARCAGGGGAVCQRAARGAAAAGHRDGRLPGLRG